jgi:hypothetical protein
VLKVDGKEAGTTPKIVDVAIGTRLNSAKRVSIQGSSRLKLLRVMRPAEVSATNWSALRTIPSSYGTGRFYPETWFRSAVCKFRYASVEILKTFDRNQRKRILLTERDLVAN